MPNQQTGFTLIELLVVITIIVVLLALLVPAMDQAMQEAVRASCLSNHHQMGIGGVTYATDNRRRTPEIASNADQSYVYMIQYAPVDPGGLTFLTGTPGLWGLGKLYELKYLADGRLFYCPVMKMERVNYEAMWPLMGTNVQVHSTYNVRYSTPLTRPTFAFTVDFCIYGNEPGVYPFYNAHAIATENAEYGVGYSDGSAKVVGDPDRMFTTNPPVAEGDAGATGFLPLTTMMRAMFERYIDPTYRSGNLRMP